MLGYFPDESDTKRFQVIGDPVGYEEIRHLIEEITREGDRGAVIICVSFLEDILKQILVAYARDKKKMEVLLDRLNGENARQLCASLGLISDLEQTTIATLSKVRNKFAHRVNVGFADADVKNACNGLSFAEYKSNTPITARDRFLSNSFVLLMELSDRPGFFTRHPPIGIEIRRTVQPF